MNIVFFLFFLIFSGFVSSDILEGSERLCANDILQAKLIVLNDDGYRLGDAILLLKRAEDCDKTGDAKVFYAIALIKDKTNKNKDSSAIYKMIEESSKMNNRLAVAFMYKIYSEGYLIGKKNNNFSIKYKDMYEKLSASGDDSSSIYQAVKTLEKLLK